MEKNQTQKLIQMAAEIRKNSYAPYSNFKVGAALLTQEDEVFLGVNVENAGYGATICAERVAINNAVVAGKREFKAIAIVGGNGFAFPCGICRQVMAEFCGADFVIIVAKNSEEYELFTLGELLPKAFKLT